MEEANRQTWAIFQQVSTFLLFLTKKVIVLIKRGSSEPSL